MYAISIITLDYFGSVTRNGYSVGDILLGLRRFVLATLLPLQSFMAVIYIL